MPLLKIPPDISICSHFATFYCCESFESFPCPLYICLLNILVYLFILWARNERAVLSAPFNASLNLFHRILQIFLQNKQRKCEKCERSQNPSGPANVWTLWASFSPEIFRTLYVSNRPGGLISQKIVCQKIPLIFPPSHVFLKSDSADVANDSLN